MPLPSNRPAALAPALRNTLPRLSRGTRATLAWIIFLASTASLHAQLSPSASQDATVAELTRLDSIWLGAYATQDVEAVERILAPDFVGQLGATMADKRTILERVASSTDIVALPLDRITVNVYGDIGVVHAVRRQIVRLPDGALEESRFAYTDVYRRRGDRWLCITGQSASLPPEG